MGGVEERLVWVGAATAGPETAAGWVTMTGTKNFDDQIKIVENAVKKLVPGLKNKQVRDYWKKVARDCVKKIECDLHPRAHGTLLTYAREEVNDMETNYALEWDDEYDGYDAEGFLLGSDVVDVYPSVVKDGVDYVTVRYVTRKLSEGEPEPNEIWRGDRGWDQYEHHVTSLLSTMAKRKRG